MNEQNVEYIKHLFDTYDAEIKSFLSKIKNKADTDYIKSQKLAYFQDNSFDDGKNKQLIKPDNTDEWIQKIISDNKNEFIKDKGLEDDLFEIIIVNSKKNTDLVLVHDGWALAKLYTTLTNSNMDDDAFNKTDILDKQEIINLFNTNADGTKSNRCIQFVKYDDLPLKEQQKDQPAVNMISALYSPALYSPALYSPTKEGGKKKRNKSHKKTAKKHKRKRTHSRRKKL